MLCEVNELLINPPSPTKANTCNSLNCKKNYQKILKTLIIFTYLVFIIGKKNQIKESYFTPFLQSIINIPLNLINAGLLSTDS